MWDYQTLIREQLIDYARSAVTHTRGITAMRKLLDFAAQYQIKSGIHGVELDEEAAARFPYQPAYLPFNRLKDGTVHDR